MIKTLIPYNNTEKTAEIMSRYRPIAPKPEVSCNFPATDPSQKIRQSTFLRNVWPQLQARPTRTRKRGRTAASSSAISPPSPALKRSRTATPSSCLSLLPHLSLSTINGGGFEDSASNPSLVTLSLLPPPPPPPPSDQTCPGSEINFMKSFDEGKKEMEMEMNGVVFNEIIPEEKDFLQQLQGPISTCNVITPHPVRPVGSTIRVSCINDGQSLSPPRADLKKPDEVEKEVESDILPAVISDSNNKVRMANSAYKEMVGQPECAWLDSMVTGNERLKGRRIGGEVMLHLVDVPPPPTSSNGFSCWVRIEWGSNEGKKNSISAFCDVMKLSCVSRDYHFIWRFHPQTREAASTI